MVRHRSATGFTPQGIEPEDEDPFYGGSPSPTAGRRGPAPEAKAKRPLEGLEANNRGNTVIFPSAASFNPQTGGTKTIDVLSTGRRTGEDAESIIITLGLETSPDPEVVPRTGFYVVAEIEWGIGGATFIALVDWDRGKQISIAASSVTVRAIVTIIGAGFDGSFQQITAPDLALSVGFAYGAISDSGAKRTMFPNGVVGTSIEAHSAGAVADGGPDYDAQKIPNFARSMRVVCVVPLQTDDIEVRFFENNYPTTPRNRASYLGAGPHPIPNGANYFKIMNNNPEVAQPEIIFDLSL